MNAKKLLALLIVFMFSAPADFVHATDPQVVAILSSDLSAYKEAYAAFQKKIGQPTISYSLDSSVPSIGAQTKVVVAFGGKAALQPIPGNVPLIYCMAPNLELPLNAANPVVKVRILPESAMVLEKYKAIQPSLTTLAVLWSSEGFRDYVEELAKRAPHYGISILSVRVESASKLPDRVREIHGKANAVWLLPDSILVTPGNFALVRDFAKTDKLPFFAPSLNLVNKGASAAVMPGFAEIGSEAAVVAQEVISGSFSPGVVYPSKVQVIINKSAFQEIGLVVPESVLSGADQVLP